MITTSKDSQKINNKVTKLQGDRKPDKQWIEIDKKNLEELLRAKMQFLVQLFLVSTKFMIQCSDYSSSNPKNSYSEFNNKLG